MHYAIKKEGDGVNKLVFGVFVFAILWLNEGYIISKSKKSIVSN